MTTVSPQRPSTQTRRVGYVAKVFPHFAFVSVIPSDQQPSSSHSQGQQRRGKSTERREDSVVSASSSANNNGGEDADPELELYEGRQVYCGLNVTDDATATAATADAARRKHRRLELVAGQVIEFSLEAAEKGPRAVNVTGPNGADIFTATPVIRTEFAEKEKKAREDAQQRKEKQKEAKRQERMENASNPNNRRDGNTNAEDDNAADRKAPMTEAEREALQQARKERREKQKEARQAKQLIPKVISIDTLARDAVVERLLLNAETRLPPYQMLPLTSIILPSNAASFAEAKAFLLSQPVLGFDTETRPNFVAGAESRPADLVQFSTMDKAYLIQMQRGNIAKDLVAAVISNPSIMKVGFGLQSDTRALAKAYGADAVHNIVDVDTLTPKALCGIRKAVPAVLGQYFAKSKSITMTNWALPKLSPKQIQYAASDAHGALAVYLQVRQWRIGFDAEVKAEMIKIKGERDAKAKLEAEAAEALAAKAPQTENGVAAAIPPTAEATADAPAPVDASA